MDFPYANLLSLVSVATHHPESEILIFVVDEAPRVVWFDLARLLPNVSVLIRSAETIFQDLPEHLQGCARVYSALSSQSLAARSNILRYALLYLYGGIYLDFDVLLIHDLNNLLVNRAFIGEELVWVDDENRLRGQKSLFLLPRNILWAGSQVLSRLDSYLFGGQLGTARILSKQSHRWSKTQANNAVIGSVPRGKFVEALLIGVTAADVEVRYDTGPHLVDRISDAMSLEVLRLAPQYFYEIPPGQSFRLFHDLNLRLSEDSVLIHYVASNHREFVSKFSGRRHSLYRRGSLISKEINRLEIIIQEATASVFSGARHAM